MRRRLPLLFSLAFIAAFAYWIWDALQPGPILPGDKRWCQAIRDKPIDAWSGEEAMGYAQNNCMRWDLVTPGDETGATN